MRKLEGMLNVDGRTRGRIRVAGREAVGRNFGAYLRRVLATSFFYVPRAGAGKGKPHQNDSHSILGQP